MRVRIRRRSIHLPVGAAARTVAELAGGVSLAAAGFEVSRVAGLVVSGVVLILAASFAGRRGARQ